MHLGYISTINNFSCNFCVGEISGKEAVGAVSKFHLPLTELD